MRLRFQAGAAGQERNIGPAPWYRLEQSRLIKGPEGLRIAEHEEHQWVCDGTRYSELVVHDNAMLCFDVPGLGSTELGPFRKVLAQDGSLFGDGRLIARLDERSRLWRVLPLERTAEVVRIVPAEAPGSGSFFG